MSTAYYRVLAQDLESRLEWERAAQAWQRAIDAYSTPRGQLRDRDVANMMERRDGCVAMAQTKQARRDCNLAGL